MKSEWRNFLLKRSNLQKLHYEDGRLPITYGAMSSAGLETTKLSNYDEVNK
jgi:hypothetical protein